MAFSTNSFETALKPRLGDLQYKQLPKLLAIQNAVTRQETDVV